MYGALEEYFDEVDTGPKDFFTLSREYDWIITNPPFSDAEKFILHAYDLARIGVCMLCRTQFLEGKQRYANLYTQKAPSYVAQFVERVPMVKGRLDPKATTATAYAWFVWLPRERTNITQVLWIPPCRTELEKEEDYG